MFLISKYPFGFLRRLMGKISFKLPEDVSAFSGFSFSVSSGFAFFQGHQVLRFILTSIYSGYDYRIFFDPEGDRSSNFNGFKYLVNSFIMNEFPAEAF